MVLEILILWKSYIWCDLCGKTDPVQGIGRVEERKNEVSFEIWRSDCLFGRFQNKDTGTGPKSQHKKTALRCAYLMFNLFYRKFGRFTSMLARLVPMGLLGKLAIKISYNWKRDKRLRQKETGFMFPESSIRLKIFKNAIITRICSIKTWYTTIYVRYLALLLRGSSSCE